MTVTRRSVLVTAAAAPRDRNAPEHPPPRPRTPPRRPPPGDATPCAAATAGASPWSTRAASPTRPAPMPAPPTPTTTTATRARSPYPRLEHRADPHDRARHHQRHRLLPRAASAGTGSPSRSRRPGPRKRVSVEFDGVYMDAYVHCNGTQVGHHPYGYTGFALDLTDLVHTDGTTPNVLAVKVQNQLPSSPLVLRQRHLPRGPPGDHRNRCTWHRWGTCTSPPRRSPRTGRWSGCGRPCATRPAPARRWRSAPGSPTPTAGPSPVRRVRPPSRTRPP